jgi:predicted metal-dependent hydrolase
MHNIDIQITKSWRKSLSMRFDKHGVLQVKAPKFLLRPQIDAFISKNQAWIDRESDKIIERVKNKEHYLF